MYRSVSRRKCAFTSSSNSRSGFRLLNSPFSFAAKMLNRAITLLLPLQTQDAADHARDALPILGLPCQLLDTAFRDGVILGFPVVLRRAPIGIDPTLLLKPQ